MLIKFVAHVIFQLPYYELSDSRGLCHEINRACARFWWGLVKDRKKILGGVGRKCVWIRSLEGCS